MEKQAGVQKYYSSNDGRLKRCGTRRPTTTTGPGGKKGADGFTNGGSVGGGGHSEELEDAPSGQDSPEEAGFDAPV